jgi:Tol biopolymer transport system component
MHSVQNGGAVSMSILALDLTSGQINIVFQAPDTAWIDFISVAPDESKLVMAYLPPRGSNQPGASQQTLYLLPLDGSGGPQLLFPPANPNFQYFQPVWSPDGKYIYFSGVDYGAPPHVQGQHYSYYELYRIPYLGGQPQKLMDEAYWPRLSPDGARLAYVTLDPVDGTNKLFVANPDASGAYQVQLQGLYVPPIIDSPFFTPDDKNVLYSAVSPTQSRQPNLIERLLGITEAYAHTVPSDWWSVPIAGGIPTQLTHLAVTGLYASLSPNEQYLASYSGNGIFLMKPDGTQLTSLVPDTGAISGTVNWIP